MGNVRLDLHGLLGLANGSIENGAGGLKGNAIVFAIDQLDELLKRLVGVLSGQVPDDLNLLGTTVGVA